MVSIREGHLLGMTETGSIKHTFILYVTLPHSPPHTTLASGLFSLSTLLLKLVSGMGLLTLTATIIDTLALYVLPDRTRYRSSVYEESPLLRARLKKQDDKQE